MVDRDDPNPERAWIFLSHSHRDLAKVRQIRDFLERKSHNPLIFFLKFLEDDNSELPELLRREIEARNWFILCDSPNSRASKWVQEEVQMIRSLEGKVFEVIDLSKDLQNQLHKLINLSKRVTIYLSYSYKDINMARKLAKALRAKDYTVFLYDDIAERDHSFQRIIEFMDHATKNGFVLLLLSINYISSKWNFEELKYAFFKLLEKKEESNIVPILLDEIDVILAKIPLAMKIIMSGMPFIDFATDVFGENIEKLVSNLKTRKIG
jgi:hypothetical protein